MSRIGKKPIEIPKNVNINFNKNIFTVKGKLGILSKKIPENIKLKFSEKFLYIFRKKNDKESKSFHGLYNVLIKNMIVGVSSGFQKKLELIGVGYRAVYNKNSRILDMNLGFSHKIMIQIPNEIDIILTLEKSKNTIITIKSIDKQLLGIFSAKIRSFRKPEPFKGKGVRYLGEHVRRKTGKSA